MFRVDAIQPLSALTPHVAKHRSFVWLSSAVLPDSLLYAICREDDVTFGILSSQRRSAWALAIAEAAHRLNRLREKWLNPPEWVDRVPEVAPGYPDRLVPKPEHESELKKRTLTNLYNARPAWLVHAHAALDAAVANAYGWEDYTPEMPDNEILSRLLALNAARSSTVGREERPLEKEKQE